MDEAQGDRHHRLVILGSAVLAVAAAGFGAAIRDRRHTIDS
jgi:hypothetical protein